MTNTGQGTSHGKMAPLQKKIGQNIETFVLTGYLVYEIPYLARIFQRGTDRW